MLGEVGYATATLNAKQVAEACRMYVRCKLGLVPSDQNVKLVVSAVSSDPMERDLRHECTGAEVHCIIQIPDPKD